MSEADPNEAGVAAEGESDDDRALFDTDQVEQALRGRLVLGRFADDQLGFDHLRNRAAPGALGGAQGLGGVFAEARRMDVPLQYVYEREYAARYGDADFVPVREAVAR